MAVNNAAGLLEYFRADGIAVEMTDRARRCLLDLAHVAPLRDEVATPAVGCRDAAEGGRRILNLRWQRLRRRLPHCGFRPWSGAFDYGELEAALAFVEDRIEVMRQSLTPHAGTGSRGTSETDQM